MSGLGKGGGGWHGGGHHGGGHGGGWGRRGWGRRGGWWGGPYYSYPVTVPCACPEVYAPVVASDGQVYDNACLAQCNGAYVIGPARNIPEVRRPGSRG